MQPKTKAQSISGLSDQNFRSRMLTPDRGHHRRSLFLRNVISHFVETVLESLILRFTLSKRLSRSGLYFASLS